LISVVFLYLAAAVVWDRGGDPESLFNLQFGGGGGVGQRQTRELILHSSERARAEWGKEVPRRGGARRRRKNVFL
jgi:hypothetical protein